MNLAAEIFVDGTRHVVDVHDLSTTGLFVRASDEVIATIEVGGIVRVALAAGARRVVAAARVTHALTAADGRTVGRFAGVGLELCEPLRTADRQFAEVVARLVAGCAERVPTVIRRIVVADAETRLLERLSTALGEAGFAVATATNGMEALSACMRQVPDLVLLARDLPVVDGFRALAEIQRHPRLAGVPVIITSDDPNDLVAAFELGAMDFIARPFSSIEVVLRARRLAHVVAAGSFLDMDAPDTVVTTITDAEVTAPYATIDVSDDGAEHGSEAVAEARTVTGSVVTRLGSQGTAMIPAVEPWQPGRERVMLRGSLADLQLPSLFGLIEQERKSGRLALVRGRDTASVEVLDGRIVRASHSSVPGDTRTVMMTLLDWTDGEFTLAAATPEPSSRPALALTHLLLEHARVRDEEAHAQQAPRSVASA